MAKTSTAALPADALDDALEARWITLGEIVAALAGTADATRLRARDHLLALGLDDLRPLRIGFDDGRGIVVRGPALDAFHARMLGAVFEGRHTPGDPVLEWCQHDVATWLDRAGLGALAPMEWSAPLPTVIDHDLVGAGDTEALSLAADAADTTPVTDPPAPSAWCSTKEVLALTGIRSATTLRKLRKAGDFPAPRRLYDAANGALRWRESDVRSWLDARARADDRGDAPTP